MRQPRGTSVLKRPEGCVQRTNDTPTSSSESASVTTSMMGSLESALADITIIASPATPSRTRNRRRAVDMRVQYMRSPGGEALLGRTRDFRHARLTGVVLCQGLVL